MILFNKAIEEQNAGNLDNALQIYEKIIKIKTDYCEAVHNKACVLTLKNKLTDALEFFKVALNLERVSNRKNFKRKGENLVE